MTISSFVKQKVMSEHRCCVVLPEKTSKGRRKTMHHIAPQGSQRTPATFIAATMPELTIEILNSVF